MFYSLPAYQVISFIEHVIIELAMIDAQYEEAQTKIYTKLKRQIKDSRTDGGSSNQDRIKPKPTNYVQPTEQGYPGLEAPLG